MIAEMLRQESLHQLALDRHVMLWAPLVANARTPEEALYIGEEAVTALDGICENLGLMREDCLVSGTGVWSEPIDQVRVSQDETDTRGPAEAYVQQVRGEIDGKRGMFIGFDAEDLDGKGVHSLYYKFLLSQGEVRATPTYMHTVGLFMYVEPTTALVIPIKELTGPFEQINYFAFNNYNEQASNTALNTSGR